MGLRTLIKKNIPSRSDAKRDLGTGLALGLVNVPDGLAMGILAGISPLAGLYGYLVGTVVGALGTSSVLMSIQVTGAMAVLMADVPEVRSSLTQQSALATLGLLTGVIMLLLGLLKLGSLVRFVPNAVLVGFVSAVAINIMIGQLGHFTGYESDGANRLMKLVDTALHGNQFDWPTVLIAVLTLVLIVVLEKTPLKSLGLVVAVILTSGATQVFSLTTVSLVSSIATIPSSLPGISLPSFALVLPLLVPAISLAFVGLVQGAAISQTVPNPDGKYPDVSGDFRGQGIANIASGFLQGAPVGGSMSATGLVIAGGGRTRLVNLSAGAVMIIVILLLGNLAGYIAMPALAALLMLVGYRTLKPEKIFMVWKTGVTQATVMSVTFVLTILIPLQYAVLAGIAISIVLFVARQSNKIVVKRWVFTQNSPLPREEAPPAFLEAGDTVVLSPYGSLFFAAAPVFESQLPRVTAQSSGSVVILRLRGKEDLGSTFIQVITRYAQQIHAQHSYLLLCGVGERAYSQLSQTQAVRTLGKKNIFTATPVVGESLTNAIRYSTELLSPTEPPTKE